MMQHHRDEDDDDAIGLDPYSVFSPSEYRKWNLDVRSEKVTQMWNGKSDEYETWRDLMTDLCASQCMGWRAILEDIPTSKDPLTLSKLRSTHMHLGLTGPQHVVLADVSWGDLGRCMDKTQRANQKILTGQQL